MKLLNRLTIKHLLMNKKRTIVTIIGITLSTALMVGIGLLVSTFLQAMIDDTISSSGSYHAYFDNVTKEEVNEIKNHLEVEKTYSYGTVGYANINSTNDYKPYLFIASADDTYFSHETLLEGRYPTNEEEIVIPSHLNTNGEVNLKIGDTITLEVGPRVSQGEEVYDNTVPLIEVYDETGEAILDETLAPKMTKTYTVVGIIDRSNSEDYSGPGYMAFTTKSNDIVSYRTYVEYKSVRKTYETTSTICEYLENASCQEHDSLLYYYGISRYDNVNKTITSLLAIVLSLLSVGSIIVIYNSFAISTMERKKSFGLYSSLGATPKQIKYTVFFEAFVVGLIGIILGVLGAFLGIYVVVQVLNYLIADSWGLKLVFTVNPYYIIIPILFMILVVFISAFIPAKRSSKVTAIEMIRENDEIKIPRRKVKTPKWVRKIFGIEGEIALKNMKRNKRKYRITLLSLFISIVLFISFSTYLKYGLSVTELTDLPAYDIVISTSNQEIMNEIESNALVNDMYVSKFGFAEYTVEDTSIYQDDYFKFLTEMEYDPNNLLQMTAIIIEDDEYEKLALNYQIDNETILFLNDIMYNSYNNGNRHSYHTSIFDTELNTMKLCGSVEDSCVNAKVHFVENNEKTQQFENYFHDQYTPTIFVSESLAKKYGIFTSYDLDEAANYITIYSEEYETLYNELEKKYQNTIDGYLSSPRITYEQEKNNVLAIKILMYGFIALVTLTGVTSVFNTIYTSIHLRRREFAILRSVGLSPKGFQKMIFFESLFFGLKSLLYALPVSFVIILLIANSMGYTFTFDGILIPWGSVIAAIVGVFLIVLLTMMYSSSKIKKENILNSLREENI